MGLGPEEFWRLTPFQVGVWAEGRREDRKAQREQVLIGAWYVAALSRHEKLMPLDELLAPSLDNLTSKQRAKRLRKKMKQSGLRPDKAAV